MQNFILTPPPSPLVNHTKNVFEFNFRGDLFNTKLPKKFLPIRHPLGPPGYPDGASDKNKNTCFLEFDLRGVYIILYYIM